MPKRRGFQVEGSSEQRRDGWTDNDEDIFQVSDNPVPRRAINLQQIPLGNKLQAGRKLANRQRPQKNKRRKST